MAIFQAGYQKIMHPKLSFKRYHPYLYRMGQRRYAGKGRLSFGTATQAQQYAIRWGIRAEKFFESQYAARKGK